MRFVHFQFGFRCYELLNEEDFISLSIEYIKYRDYSLISKITNCIKRDNSDFEKVFLMESSFDIQEDMVVKHCSFAEYDSCITVRYLLDCRPAYVFCVITDNVDDPF